MAFTTILIGRADGGVSVMLVDESANLTNVIEDWKSQADPAWLPITGFAQNNVNLPINKRLRDAWTFNVDRVTVPLGKARQAILKELRRERDKRLAESDSDKAKLDDIGNGQQKAALAQYRQALRDLTTTVTADITNLTIDQLHDYQPTYPTKPT